MPFFTYSQNNSGGHFDRSLEDGITDYVIIEAIDDKDADEKAERIGLYFGGVEKGFDCECCGDRWYPAYYTDADPEPMIYHQTLAEYCDSVSARTKDTVCVHYDDGRREWL